MRRLGLAVVLCVAAQLASACDECEEGDLRCHDGTVEACSCSREPLGGCDFSRSWECRSNQICVEQGRAALCVFADQPCPYDDARRYYCEGELASACFAGYFAGSSDCADAGEFCAVTDRGAVCAVEPGHCEEEGLAHCLDDRSYVRCADGAWHVVTTCADHERCEDVRQSARCTDL